MTSNVELNTILARMAQESRQHELDVLTLHVDWIENNLTKTRYNLELHEMYYRGYVEAARALIASGEILNPDRERQEWDDIYNLRYPDSIKGTCNELFTLIHFNNRSNTTQSYIPLGNKSGEIGGADLLVFQAGWPREYVVQVKTGVLDEGIIKIYTKWLKYEIEKVDRLAIVNYEQNFCWMMDYPKFKGWIENNHHVYGDATARHYIIPASEIKTNSNSYRFMDLS